MTREIQKRLFRVENARKILLEVKNILDRNDVEFFLISGTLLGAIRGKDILHHDFDIDLGAKHEILLPKLEQLYQQFTDAGFKCYLRYTPYPYARFIKISKDNIQVDILDYKQNGNDRFHLMRFNRGCWVYPKEIFDNLGEIDFLGAKFKIPNPVEKYLELSYTVSWTVEDKEWNWQNAPCLKWDYADFMRKRDDLITPVHLSTKRDYKGRMDNNKVECARIARKFDYNFFDGERKFGYGGYKDDGRCKSLAEKIIRIYGLDSSSRVLDIGCGKGYLLNEIKKQCDCDVTGYDISQYAVDNCVVENKFHFVAGEYTISENFDLIISINTLHNLILPKLKQAIEQIKEHSKQQYICVESYRNEQELHNLQCWALTCEQFLRPEEWEFLFKEWGYKGDYEFIFFE